MPRKSPKKSPALLRDYENPLVSFNKALLGPYFLGGGGIGGVPLDSHDAISSQQKTLLILMLAGG